MVLLEYRLNALLVFVGDLIWIIVTVVFFKILYLNIGNIAGWDFSGLLLILAAYFIIDAVAWFSYENSLREVSTSIQDGSLDFILIKPLDNQFFASVNRLYAGMLGPIVPAILILVFAIHSMSFNFCSAVFLFLFLIMVGIVLHYSLLVLLALTGFFFIRNNNLWNLDHAIRSFSRFPLDVYPSFLRFILSIIIPVGVMTTFPAKAFLGTLPWFQIIFAIILAAAFFFLSRQLWNWAVSHYQSASS